MPGTGGTGLKEAEVVQRAGLRGSPTVNTVSPFSRSGARLPPCASTSPRATDRPGPLPPRSRLRALSTRWKRSKTRSRSAAGMPGPASAIRTRAASGAVATSGRYERGDHILDGRTGRPATGLLSLTVPAPPLTEADATATATAAFALGEDGVAWAAARTGCEVFAVDAGRRVVRTDGMPMAEAGWRHRRA